MPQIEVAFDIDANGILHVSASDKGTGREQKITIQAGTGLSEEEIERMKHDAESYAAEDQQRREEVEIRNQADSLAYTAEKTIHDAGDNLSPEIRADIETRVKDVRDASSAQGASVDTIRAALAGLSESLQKAGTAIYGAGAEDGAADPHAGSPSEGEEERPADEGAVEGEFREV